MCGSQLSTCASDTRRYKLDCRASKTQRKSIGEITRCKDIKEIMKSTHYIALNRRFANNVWYTVCIRRLHWMYAAGSVLRATQNIRATKPHPNADQISKKSDFLHGRLLSVSSHPMSSISYISIGQGLSSVKRLTARPFCILHIRTECTRTHRMHILLRMTTDDGDFGFVGCCCCWLFSCLYSI